MSRGDSRRGIQRERDLAAQLGEEGWYVLRSAGSKGWADLIALKAGRRPRMIEVKSVSGGDFAGFPPAKRRQMIEAAKQAGCEAWLVTWPKHKKPKWIPACDWP
jgi:Holliday junction resolvase